MGDTSDTSVSRQTLEATYGRAVQFLRGVGTNPIIRALLEAHGYTEKDHAEGWRHVLAAGGYQAPAVTPPTASTSEAREAMEKAHLWQEPTHRVLRATLQRRFPEQLSFLIEGLTPSTGMESVAGVSTLLDRLDVLTSGEGRSKATHRQDQAALELLEQRTITAAKRKEMRALTERAQQGDTAAPSVDPKLSQAAADREKHHEEALLELRHWYEEWSEMARVALTRRDHLIAVGLAKRKPRKSEK